MNAARSTGPMAVWRRLPTSSQQILVAATVVVVLVGYLGVVIGRATASPGVADIDVVERDIVPLAVDADALWTAGSGQAPAIADQLAALRRGEHPADVVQDVDRWRASYDTILRQLVGIDVAPAVRPVQRQFVAAVTLSRDALDLIVAAAETDDPDLRRDLTSEALRLRTRAEQLTQSARASLADLTGRASQGVSLPTDLPPLSELR